MTKDEYILMQDFMCLRDAVSKLSKIAPDMNSVLMEHKDTLVSMVRTLQELTGQLGEQIWITEEEGK